MNKSPSYSEAFTELQQIVADIESGEITVDIISDKVKRAAGLIKICKSKLTATEEEVSRILLELEAGDENQEK